MSMPSIRYLCSLMFAWTLIPCTQTYMICTECVPLERLLREAYGIQLTASGLHAAVAFHNGTINHVGTTLGSDEYQALMHSIVQAEVGSETQSRLSARCRRRTDKPSVHPCDHGFFTCISYLVQLPKRLWERYCPQTEIEASPPIPLDPKVQLFKEQLEALPPFDKMSAKERSQVTVGISFPPWMMGTNETCHLAEAGSMVFGQGYASESTPSAAYTAMGYELCRISRATFDCVGSGRIMTVEFEDDLVTLAMTETPLLYFFNNPVKFAVAKNLDADSLKDWISQFVDAEKPDMVMVVGGNAGHAQVESATAQSRAAPLLIERSDISSHRVVAMGAARYAKDTLERQPFDCLELQECRDIRKEADRRAGEFNGPTPSTQPMHGHAPPPKHQKEEHVEL